MYIACPTLKLQEINVYYIGRLVVTKLVIVYNGIIEIFHIIYFVKTLPIYNIYSLYYTIFSVCLQLQESDGD